MKPLPKQQIYRKIQRDFTKSVFLRQCYCRNLISWENLVNKLKNCHGQNCKIFYHRDHIIVIETNNEEDLTVYLLDNHSNDRCASHLH